MIRTIFIKNIDFLIFLTLFFTAAIFSILLFTNNSLITPIDVVNQHKEFINHEALSPYRYRIFAPILIEIFRRIIPIPYNESITLSYFFLYLFSIFGFLFAQWKYLLLWFSKRISLIGIFLSVIAILSTITNFGSHPWTFIEVFFLQLALISLYKKQNFLFFIYLILSSINRETSIFLVIIFFLITENYKKSIVYFSIWLLIFFAIRSYFGFVEHTVSLEYLLNRNLRPDIIISSLINLSVMLGGIIIFAIRGYENAEFFHKKSLLMIIPYLATIAVWGIWTEIRLLIFLLPVLIPISLSALKKVQQI